MTFLSPMSALAVAAIALPLLLLLYFLKLRRRFLRMPSTLLWERAVEDVEVNAPFQRIRWSFLLFLQLLLLILLLLALAQPVAGGQEQTASRIVLLIDRSASMNTNDAPDGSSRLDAAKRTASEMVERLSRGSGATQIMVIAFGRTPMVVSSFEFDRATILAAINSIQPSDEEANLDAALQLAAGFAGDSEDVGAQSGDVVLFSDGVVNPPRDPVGHRLRVGRFRYVHIGPGEQQPINNLGIVSFSARRDYDDPVQVLVFARILNAGIEPITTTLTLRHNDQVVDVRRVPVPGRTEVGRAGAPGETAVSFAVPMEQGGILELEHTHRDALVADNHAWMVVPPPIRPRIAMVYPDTSAPSPFVLDLAQMLDPRAIEQMTRDQFSRLDERDLDAGRAFDFILFDRVQNHRLPGVPSLTFGGVPRGVNVREPRDDRGRRVLSWERQHPVMRHVSLDPIVYAGFSGYELPPGATTLASGPQGALIALISVRHARHVLVGFDLSRSNWPMHVSIAVFLQNVFDHLTLTGSGQAGLVAQPGQTVSVRAVPDATEFRIQGPQSMRAGAEAGQVRALPPLSLAGVYEVAGAAPPMDRVAVSMLSDVESDIRPRTELRVNAETASGGAAAGIVPRELWPWLLSGFLALLMLEWLAYCRKLTA